MPKATLAGAGNDFFAFFHSLSAAAAVRTGNGWSGDPSEEHSTTVNSALSKRAHNQR